MRIADLGGLALRIFLGSVFVYLKVVRHHNVTLVILN